MKYIKRFSEHTNYISYITNYILKLPNVSYCENDKKIHFNKMYIKNGLISMFDGIWNKSMGVHDDTITTWNDLITTNCKFTLSSASWTDNSFNVATTTTTATITAFNYISAEFIIKVDYHTDTSYNEPAILTGMNGLGLYMQFRTNYTYIYFTDNSSDYTNHRYGINYFGEMKLH